MKLLKISVPNGYKMLEKGFTINFLTKTRIDRSMPNEDLFELEEGLYYPIETVLVGKNSSGKSTTLELINIVMSLASDGRIKSSDARDGESFDLDVLFYQDKRLFHYIGSFVKGNGMDEYLRIKEEALQLAIFRSHYKKDLSNASFHNVKEFIPNVGGNTSNLPRFCGENSSFYLPSGQLFYGRGLKPLLDTLLKIYSEESIQKLIHLFDDSIEYIKPWNKAGESSFSYEFKRVGEEKILVDGSFLESHVSEGTNRGVLLYGISMLLFRTGGYLVVDEIERSFHKNLVGNLILMFNDPEINRAQACLIYTTHYSELLDQQNRNDNINILHRDKKSITISNMAEDYDVRVQLRHSAQFDDNVFDNLMNYDRLMELKEVLRSK